MYERSYGYRYKTVGTTKAAAAQMRRDIRALVDAGMLPGAPVSYSVQYDSFSGGSAINIEVRGYEGEEWEPQEWTCRECCTITGGKGDQWPDACPHCNAHNFDLFGRRKRTAAAAAIVKALEEIHNAYNHDGSEIQSDYFDVRYYGSVRFEAPWRREIEAEKKAKRAALDAAMTAGTKSYANYSREGRRVVHLAAEVEGKWKLVCGARLWSSGFGGVTENPETPTCSRCAKKAGR